MEGAADIVGGIKNTSHTDNPDDMQSTSDICRKSSLHMLQALSIFSGVELGVLRDIGRRPSA
jgi:hypothetical protein